MADFPTYNDLFRAARDEVLIRQGKLTREIVEREGTDANILTALASAAGEQVVNQLADVASGLYLDSAKEEALDRLVFDRYGIVRKSASPALGSVDFTTSVVTVAAFTIPAGTLLSTADGIQFVTSDAALFPLGSAGPVVVAVRSVLAGKSQQAAINKITSIIGTIPNAPGNLSVNNSKATSGADDDESDDSLRSRARAFFVTARRGTIAAIEAAALGISGVRTAKAIEVLDGLGRPARFVLLVVADAFTDQLAKLDTIPPSYDLQSKQLAVSVFSGLSDIRPAGIFIQVEVASVILQPVTLALTFQAGVGADRVALEARATVVNAINALKPGATMVRTALVEALRIVPGLVITGGEIASPAGDVTAKPLQVLRSTLALVTAASSQTGTPLALSSNPDAFIT